MSRVTRRVTGTRRIGPKAAPPSWDEVFRAWAEHAVPPIEVVGFEPGRHDSSAPWYDRLAGEQIYCSGDEHATAFHLCRWIARADERLQAAYRLGACRREAPWCDTSSLVESMRAAFGSASIAEAGWWAAGTIHVLPRFGGAAQLLPAADSTPPLPWHEFVDHAARRWHGLAERFALIRIPSLMELDSPELAAWQARRAGRRG